MSLSTRAVTSRASGWRSAQFSFGALSAHRVVGAVPASQFRCGPSGGQMKVGACRDRIGAAVAAAGLEGLLAREHVPGGDQHLARDGGLAGVGLALALCGLAIEPVPGVR